MGYKYLTLSNFIYIFSYWKNKNGDKPYPSMVVYFDEVNQGNSKEKVTKNLGN